MNRVSLKIVGASGQGINSIGEVLAKGLKRAGYCIFGYREYPSLIKGGHAGYQIDVSDTLLGSSERRVDVLVALNYHGLQVNLPDLKEGGVLIHSTQGWKFGKEEETLLRERKIRTVLLPVEAILQKLGAKPIMGNVLIATEDGRLRLSGTNLDLGITSWIGAKITTEGATTVSRSVTLSSARA
ncbi:MAG: 2-oxoacid:acceptor oxidoreductase family protein, partial [Patescibacteria group bacterium]